jgi:hypothetical protein
VQNPTQILHGGKNARDFNSLASVMLCIKPLLLTLPDVKPGVAAGTNRAYSDAESENCIMTVFDLAKATLVCGGLAFLIYSFPLLGQIVLIGFLTLLWMLYLRKTLQNLRRH